MDVTLLNRDKSAKIKLKLFMLINFFNTFFNTNRYDGYGFLFVFYIYSSSVAALSRSGSGLHPEPTLGARVEYILGGRTVHCRATFTHTFTPGAI